jgi:hypothetical protein
LVFSWLKEKDGKTAALARMPAQRSGQWRRLLLFLDPKKNSIALLDGSVRIFFPEILYQTSGPVIVQFPAGDKP